MSIKRQIQFKYQNFVHSMRTISMPGWINSKAIRFGLVAIVFLFGTAYIVKTASSATSGYQMHELEKKTALLQTEVQKLQVEIANQSSMASISSRLVKLNMVEADKIKYFTLKNTAVAKN